MDIDVYTPREPLELQIRLEDAESEAEFAAGSVENADLTLNRFSLYMERSCFPPGTFPDFMLIVNDERVFSHHARPQMRLADHDTGRVVFARRLRFGKVYRIPREKMIYDPHPFNHLDLIVTCKTRDGRMEEKRRSVYNDDFAKYVPELLDKARLIAANTVCAQRRRETLLGMIARIEAYDADSARYKKFLFSEILKELLDDERKATEEERYIKGDKRVYFHDTLDDFENYYRVTLPKNYDPAREHPLLLICSTKEYGSYGSRLENAGFEDMIAVDVSVRGVTLGSYIGEAAFLHALEDIRATYRIDPDRIYIGGYSNGASAALALAQAYPHLFAGVYALSGRAEKNKMGNLANLYTVLMTAKDDEFYADSMALLNAREINREKIEMRILPQHNHYTLQRVWLNKRVLTDFFTHERDPYPTRFSYFTDRNRHLQAYWISLHGIKPTAKACKLSVDAGRSIIDISVRGATGLTIELPPFIDKAQFTVRMNGRETQFCHHSEKVLHFSQGSRGFHRIPYPPVLENGYKGNGLLDVYMDPMCVVTPNDAAESVKNAAQTLARPHSNSMTPEIGVWYPTYSLTQLLENRRYFDCSMIVVGRDASPFYKELDKLCTISTTPEGYICQKKFIKTPYCCMQIIPNPWNRSKHILYITYNDERTFRRNLFMRNMVLPSYIQGRHPYLNEQAMVFDGKNYFVLITPNGSLQQIGGNP